MLANNRNATQIRSKQSKSPASKNSALNPSRKRKFSKLGNEGREEPVKLSGAARVIKSSADEAIPKSSAEKAQSSSTKQAKKTGEKRLRRYRDHAPASFIEKLHRAQTQRMIVIDRNRVERNGHIEEEIDIVGSTGNIYRVTLGVLPTCTCPDSLKGNECKHKVYALHTVLKAPEHLQYQRALLKSELEDILTNAPPTPLDVSQASNKDGRRKSAEGECPICYMDLDEQNNKLVWCQAACGNNVHKSCFDQWTASQRGETVKCVYCRTPWELTKSDIEAITQSGELTEEGYVNVGEQFGISRARDYTTYHQPWVRRTIGMGW